MEWETHPQERSGHVNRLGCLAVGLGGINRGDGNRRPLVCSGAAPSHQCAGVDSGILRSEDICEERKGPPCPPPDGQHDGSGICKPSGGDQVSSPGEESEGAVGLVPGSADHTFGRIPTGMLQPTSNLDFCRHQQSGSWIPTSSGCWIRFWVPAARTSLQLDSQVPPEGQGGEGDYRAGSPSVAQSALVPPAAGVLSDRACTSHPAAASSETHSGNHTPCSIRSPQAGRLESLTERLSAKGISQQASALISAGWSKGTNKSYQSAWNKWQSWCLQRNLDPLSAPVSTLVNFLTHQFEEGLQHRSINAIRSAVSVTHDQVDGTPIGQHPVVSRLMRGIYNSRPPTPKYVTTWKVSSMTSCIRSWGQNSSLSMKQLTLKLAMLMALTGACRSSELAALDLS